MSVCMCVWERERERVVCASLCMHLYTNTFMFQVGWTLILYRTRNCICMKNESESHSVMSDSLQLHGLYIYSLWNSQGQNIGVGSRSLLQGIFPTRDRTQVSCIVYGFFTNWATRDMYINTAYMQSVNTLCLGVERKKISYKIYYLKLQNVFLFQTTFKNQDIWNIFRGMTLCFAVKENLLGYYPAAKYHRVCEIRKSICIRQREERSV